MQRVFSANDLLDNAIDVSTPVFLDTTSWREFQLWAKENLRQLKVPLTKGLTFWIFVEELSRTEPSLYELYLKDQEIEEDEDLSEEEVEEETDDSFVSFENQLANNLGVRFHSEQLPPEDIPYKTFLYEVQEIYFHDVKNRERCDRHAEFTFLLRRAMRNEDTLRVLTAQPAFQRLVNAEIYLFPKYDV
jgi:hypothetical protein